MSSILVEPSWQVAEINLDGTQELSEALIGGLTGALNRVEERAPHGVMLIHVGGAQETAPGRLWPGVADLAMVSRWERLLRRLERGRLPVAVTSFGACSWLPVDLCLVADRRLAGQDFTAQQARYQGRVWPGMSLYRLAHQVGAARARQLVLDTAELNALTALGVGIIDAIVENKAAAIDRILGDVELGVLDDFAVCRRLLQDSRSADGDDAIGAHLAACDRAIRTAAVKPQAMPRAAILSAAEL